MKTIAITGGSGLLAMNWAFEVRNKFNVYLLLHQHGVQMQGVQTRKVRLDTLEAMTAELNDLKIDLIVHAAGMTNVEECELNPDLAERVNSLIAANVAEYSRKNNIQHVHVSSDHLFNGDKSFSSEVDEPSPVNIYAKTKLKAEKLVQLSNPDSLLVRTNFFGWGHRARFSFSDWVLQSLERHESVNLYENIFYTPILISELALAVHDLLERNISGIINVSGPDRVSKFDFGCILADEFGLDKNKIIKSIMINPDDQPRRPFDMSLSSDYYMSKSGIPISDVKTSIRKLHGQKKSGQKKEIINAYRN